MMAKCPICKETYPAEKYALSRDDNTTHICSSCGRRQGMEDVRARKLIEVLRSIQKGELESVSLSLKATQEEVCVFWHNDAFVLKKQNDPIPLKVSGIRQMARQIERMATDHLRKIGFTPLPGISEDKMCPDCQNIISKRHYAHAHKHEWCPKCGFSM